MANQVIDVEDVVKKHAWKAYQDTTKDKDKIPYGDVGMKVIWDRVSFEASQPIYSQQHLTHPNSHVIFESTFTNKTEKEQEHSFKAERTTTVMSTTSLSKGYTMGGNISLSLAVPGDVLKATGSFGRQVKLDKATGNTNEKILTWSTNDTIKVKPRSKLTAKVEIQEDEYRSNFEMDVKIKGRVLVVITNSRENNKFLKVVDDGIIKIFTDNEETRGALSAVNQNEAIWKLKGECNFKYGVSQSIKIDEGSA